MKRKIITILLLLTGIGVIAYPYLSNYLNQKNSSRAIDSYSEAVDELSKEEVEKQWRRAEIYNENLTGQPAHDPFIPGSGIVMPQNYYDVLNLQGIMGRVEIPSINVDLPIYHGTSEKVLKKAVGHLEGSTMPIGGQGTHAVLTGHTGLTHAKLFTDLVDLVEGDQFYLTILGRTLAYQVDQIKVIKPEHTEDLKIVSGQDYCTLMTCTPYGINSHRLLVRGKRIPYQPEQKQQVKKTGLTAEEKALIRAAILTALIMVVLILITLVRKKRLEKRSS